MENKNKNWRKVKLGELGKMVTGKTPSTKELKNFGGPFPFITIPDLKNQRFVMKTERTISEIGAQKMKTLKLPVHSVVMSCLATVGETGITTKDSFTNQQINSVICDPEVIDYRFLYYIFCRLKRRLLKYGGSVYTNISKSKFSELEIELPPITEQKRIASFLSAFDDKIELNNRISQTLEQMAQAIFKHWFINNKKGNWEIKRIKDVATLKKGLSYRSDDLEDGSQEGLPLINLKSFNRGGGFNFNGLKYYSGKFQDKHIVKPGQLIVAMTDLTPTREVVGRPAIVPELKDRNKILISLDVCLVDAKAYIVEFLYFLMKQPEFGDVMANSTSGTTVAHLSKETIESFQFALPSNEKLKQFHRLATPIFHWQNKTSDENQTLSSLRDLLLPKLMSGEIRV